MASFFVLQRQPLREQEWLLDIFSEQDGRLSVVSGRSATSPDLLQCWQGDWRREDDWPRMRGAVAQQLFTLPGNALYCGLYLTELLTRFLPRHESLPHVFHSYQATLRGLAESSLPDPWLRLFEVQLLAALGYGFSWQEDVEGHPLLGHQYYLFIPRQGFVSASRGFSGDDILAFAQRERACMQGWIVAKKVLRQAIDDLLDKPLISRELFVRPAPERI